jgi:alcohol dehydrogenase (cytochrome c)
MDAAITAAPLQGNGRMGKSAPHHRPMLLGAALAVGLATAAIGAADPVGAEAEVRHGQAAYVADCQSCHGAALSNGQFGPALKGTAFKARWATRPAALLTYIKTQMPPGAAGSLDAATYADITAYVLGENGLAKGPAAAVGDAAAKQSEPENILKANEDAPAAAARAARAARLQSLAPVTDAMLRNPPDGDWLSWRRTYAGLGFSPLEQIDRSNVGRLAAAWAWVLPVSGNETTPLAHDGVLFVASGDRVQALDGATGDLLWQYVRELPPQMNNGRSGIIRSLAIHQDRLYAPTVDGHVIALDVRTGRIVWDHQVLGEAEKAAHLSLNGGPIVAGGKVIMGASGCNTYPGGCFIFGLDAATGRETWRFHTVDQSPPGADSWNGAPVEQRFGGSVWTSGSYDPELNLVYFGVGQTYDTGTLLSPHKRKGASNDALYTDSTVALDPATGRLAWHYQHMNRDIWDLDWSFEQSLVTLPVGGRPMPLVVTGGKIAVFDALDRATGRYAFSRDLGIQTLVTAIDAKTGRKTVNPALRPEAGVTKQICPHSGGGRSWPATSIDPAAKVMFVPLFESCQDFTWRPRDAAATAAGGNDMEWVLHPRPDSDGKFGRVEAIDLQTGKVLWTRRQRAAFAGSTLATAGGLVFVGSRDRYFSAFDAADGDTLWRTRLGASPSSTPISYSAGGAQYIAVVAGNGGPVAWPFLTPEIDSPAGGTTLWVFRLSDAADAAR